MMTTTVLENNTLSKEEVLEQLQEMTEKQLQFLLMNKKEQKLWRKLEDIVDLIFLKLIMEELESIVVHISMN